VTVSSECPRDELQWSPSVRVFHFVSEKYGLDDIRRRRLKISRIQDLNDPFELLSIELSNKQLRDAFHATKEKLSTNRGILCFSKKWSNPVQWSHYADKHRGLCLGFDVADNRLLTVSYTAKWLLAEVEQLLATGHSDERTMRRLLTTKFAHWKYENEVRCFVTLEDQDPQTKLYFAEFSDELKLAQVIVGVRSNLSRAELGGALGDLATGVDVLKTRLAFRSFRVVRNRNQSLWT
jgi:hypothetical protein